MIQLKNGKNIKPNNKFIFRDFFANEKDNIILKILLNYFSAVSEVFPKEWNSKQYILTKTTGYGALIKALPTLYREGEKQADLSKEFFVDKFRSVKEKMLQEGIELTSTDIGSGEQAQNRLAHIFKSVVESHF